MVKGGVNSKTRCIFLVEPYRSTGCHRQPSGYHYYVYALVLNSQGFKICRCGSVCIFLIMLITDYCWHSWTCRIAAPHKSQVVSSIDWLSGHDGDSETVNVLLLLLLFIIIFLTLGSIWSWGISKIRLITKTTKLAGMTCHLIKKVVMNMNMSFHMYIWSFNSSETWE